MLHLLKITVIGFSRFVKDIDHTPLSILIIICGILFIINPFGGALVITKVMGIFMIIYALLDLTNTIIIKKEIHEVKQEMKNAIIEANIGDKNE